MPLSRNPALLVALPLALVLGVPYFLVGGRLDFLGSMTDSPVRMAGLVPFAAGMAAMLAGMAAALSRRGGGEGGAGAAPAGPFRYVRNPVWSGALLAILSQYLLYDWPPVLAYAAVLFATLDGLVRFVAEPRLAARRGAAWEAYRAEVPRWLPRRPRRAVSR